MVTSCPAWRPGAAPMAHGSVTRPKCRARTPSAGRGAERAPPAKPGRRGGREEMPVARVARQVIIAHGCHSPDARSPGRGRPRKARPRRGRGRPSAGAAPRSEGNERRAVGHADCQLRGSFGEQLLCTRALLARAVASVAVPRRAWVRHLRGVARCQEASVADDRVQVDPGGVDVLGTGSHEARRPGEELRVHSSGEAPGAERGSAPVPGAECQDRGARRERPIAA